jgi:glycosyltransferase involved in cell wall biosynthesis
MDKIGVLYYEPTSGFGGSSRCLLGWLKELDRSKYDPLVAVHYDGPAIKKIRELRVKVIRIPFRSFYIYKSWADKKMVSYLLSLFDLIFFTLPSAIFLFVLIKKNHIKIAHLNSKPFGVIPGIIASKLAGIPCICHLHDIKTPVKREKLFARWVDCLVVLTEKARSLYKQEYPNSKIKLIANGINLKEYPLSVDATVLRKELGINDNTKVAGIIGRLVEGKGFTDFIKAAKILNEKFSDIKYVIIGSASKQDKPYEDNLRKLTTDLGLTEKVLFTGWREDIKDLIGIFDVLVQASTTFPEGFGLTVLEAMALGKPVVVTNVPGPAELVVNEKTGLIVPASNPGKLAEAIEKIVTNQEQASAMGKLGRQNAEAWFNMELTVKKIESLYDELLESAGKYA